MTTQPIVIKKRKNAREEGHHGGAWKVAYADFVTAMMAFFLLMWLLNATTEEQRKGLADYFDPSIPISAVSGGGNDMLSGDTVYATDSLAFSNHGGASDQFNDEAELVDQISAALKNEIDQEQLKITFSPEGIIVDLMEADGAPLFAVGQSVPSDLLTGVLARISPVLAEQGQAVKIIGHTDALPFRNGSLYTNWELSAERANAARRLMVQNGYPFELISEVSGKADTAPIVADKGAAENRRISIIVKSRQNSL